MATGQSIRVDERFTAIMRRASNAVGGKRLYATDNAVHRPNLIGKVQLQKATNGYGRAFARPPYHAHRLLQQSETLRSLGRKVRVRTEWSHA